MTSLLAAAALRMYALSVVPEFSARLVPFTAESAEDFPTTVIKHVEGLVNVRRRAHPSG